MNKEMMTSAAANKLLRQLQDEKDYILQQEAEANTYIKVQGYDEERPEYSFEETRRDILNIDSQIARIKHAINKFNTTAELPSGITVDVALINMAQLTKEKEILDVMRKRLPVNRKKDRYGVTNNLVEYVCANYDIDIAKTYYDAICTQIRELQIDIDYINQTVKFEVEL